MGMAGDRIVGLSSSDMVPFLQSKCFELKGLQANWADLFPLIPMRRVDCDDC